MFRRKKKQSSLFFPDNLRRYAVKPENYQEGNEVCILRDGAETYPAMLQAIRGASTSIWLETYILADDHIGETFLHALRDKAKTGVQVLLIFDGFGSMGLSSDLLNEIEEAGVRFREFHPVVPWKDRFRLQNRDHRKILVVDHLIAFCGGLNIGKDYADKSEGGGGWHDIHAKIEGPVVLELAALFSRTWRTCDGGKVEIPTKYAGPRGAMWGRIVSNRLFRQRFQFRRAYVKAIHAARKSICIMNAYFIPGPMMRRALIKAAKRGVKVDVIVPAHSDVTLVRKASEYLYGRLLHHKVEIHEWKGPMMHAKTCVIDDEWTLVGSYNLDNQSLRKNLEVAIAVVNEKIGMQMSNLFRDDLSQCEVVTLDKWKNRSLWQKVIQWVSYRFRRWL